MRATISTQGALAFWVAREARPTFRGLRQSAAELDRIARDRLGWSLQKASETDLGARRLRTAGAVGGSWRDDPGAVLRAMRPITKAEMREAGYAALVGGRESPSWRSSRSSGSTGEPFRVCYDVRAWAILKYLVKLRARAACGVRWSHRVALLDAIRPEEEGRLALERAGRVRRISVLRAADHVAASLVAFQPDVVYGLPSALLEAARCLSAMGQTPFVKAVFTSGELLDPGTRRLLREQFGAPVLDVYGTSETKEIAWECLAGGLHVNQDVTCVEILDEQGNAVPDGDEGEIVLTLLVNGAMPLVRYRTGDRGSLLSGACSCGVELRRLGLVTGREADVLELSGGRRISPYAITCALEAVPDLLRYQVSQLGPEYLRVRARAAATSRLEGVTADIRGALQQAISGPLAVDVEFVDQFTTGSRAKFRVVQPLR